MQRQVLIAIAAAIVAAGCSPGESVGTGSAGHGGTTGGAGTTGAAGTTGSAGTSGGAGTTGAAGTTGNAGTSGGAGTTGIAGTSGGAGTTGAAGTTGSAGTGGMTCAPGTGALLPTCTPTVTSMASILDFGAVTTDSASFGPFNGVAFSGGTYEYPGPASGAACDPTMHLCHDFSGMTWHITGTVHDYSGFGIYFSCKNDASAYTGIRFDARGTFTATGAGTGAVPAAQITFNVGTQADDVAAAYTATPTTATWGTCVPASCSQYDGTCSSPSKAIPLTNTLTPVSNAWTDLTGGKPNASPDRANLTYFSWALPWAGAGSAQYTVDLTIDNITFY
jgi:hypothetical protein